MAGNEIVGILRVLLTADAADYETTVAKASQVTAQFGLKFEGLGAKIASVGRTIAAGMLAAFSVHAVTNAISKVIDYTGKLTDLAGRSGITAMALQRLNFVTSQSGVELEKVANGAVLLSRNLLSGEKGAVAAVKALGLDMAALIEMGPERAFLTIGEAVAAIPNPMERAAIATELFGRSGAEFLPAFTTNMTQLADEAQRSGAILSDDMVAAGDAAGDAIGRLQVVEIGRAHV